MDCGVTSPGTGRVAEPLLGVQCLMNGSSAPLSTCKSIVRLLAETGKTGRTGFGVQILGAPRTLHLQGTPSPYSVPAV